MNYKLFPSRRKFRGITSKPEFCQASTQHLTRWPKIHSRRFTCHSRTSKQTQLQYSLLARIIIQVTNNLFRFREGPSVWVIFPKTEEEVKMTLEKWPNLRTFFLGHSLFIFSCFPISIFLFSKSRGKTHNNKSYLSCVTEIELFHFQFNWIIQPK